MVASGWRRVLQLSYLLFIFISSDALCVCQLEDRRVGEGLKKVLTFISGAPSEENRLLVFNEGSRSFITDVSCGISWLHKYPQSNSANSRT